MLINLDNQIFVIGQFEEVVDFLIYQSKFKNGKSQVILPTSLHDLALQADQDNRNFYQKVDYCTSDSMFITSFFRYKYKNKKIDRVYGPDLMLNVLHKTTRQFRHCLIAPNQIVANKMLQILNSHYFQLKQQILLFPDLNSKKQLSVLLQDISKFDPAFIWLGVGSPQQVKLAVWLKDKLVDKKIFCVGAAFDFFSDQKKQAPPWIRKSGLEWFFRLVTEPRRLWKRYLIKIPKYLFSLLFRKFFKIDL